MISVCDYSEYKNFLSIILSNIYVNFLNFFLLDLVFIIYRKDIQ